jgi:putative ABC transport system permease protein
MSLFQDLRYAFRNLGKNRAFTAIALGSLALGIGGSTAMYSVIYGVILDPFPYKDVDRLVSFNITGPDGRGFGGYYPVDQFLDLAERTTAFEGVIASTISDVVWTGSGDPQRLRGNHCTLNTFDIMGVKPMIGRAPQVSDGAAGAEPVTVLGYKFWQREFGGDPSVIGRKLHLNDKVRTVIGVMPPRFMWRGADVYLPLVFRRGQVEEGVEDVHALARLKPGVSIAQAEADVRPVLADIVQRTPRNFPKEWRVRLRTFPETFPSDIQKALWILFGAVGLLLLIACVNVSNLLLSRAAYRRREIAIRSSLGASRLRLVGQLLAESLVLGVTGGILGIATAYAALRGIIAMVPPNTIPDEAQISLNAPVLWFTLAVSVSAALIFGLAPALQMSGGDIVTPLKEAGRGTAGSTGQKILRNTLVVGEVALSLMLLVGASLMIRTLVSIQSVEFDLKPDRVLSMRIPFSRERSLDPNRVVFTREILRRMASVPGVKSVSVNAGLPPVGGPGTAVEVVGGPPPDNRPVLLHQTSEAYADVMSLSLVQGRFLSEQDVAGKVRSVVVNQTFAQRYLEGKDPVGRLVRIQRLRTYTGDPFQVVGVVKDRVNRIFTHETLPEVYVPYSIAGIADRFIISCRIPPAALERGLRAQVYATDPAQPVMEVWTVEEALGRYIYSRPRFNLILFSAFAVLGLMLALFGVYGIISNSVAQRTREIGIRIALGASLGEVVGMMLRVGAKLLAIGIGVGLVASLASVKTLSSLVTNVSTFDVYSFAAVALILFAAGLFASYWPARRAAKIDPLDALREE